MGTEKSARRIFVGLLVLSMVLLAVLVRPLFKAFLFAAVFAGTFHGVHQWLTHKFRGRSGPAAGVICFGVVVALLLPLAAMSAFIVTQAIEGVGFVTATVHREGIEGLADRLPGFLQGPAAWALERLQAGGRSLGTILQEQLSARGGRAAGMLTGAVSTTGSVVFQLVMMLIALYFFLVEGRRLVRWLESVSPLERGQTTEILREFRRVSGAVLISSVATAGVQALVAMVGYLIARVPVPLFFTAVTFFFALIPAIGGSAVSLAAALLLLLTGHPWMALFLAIWGVVVVGLSDNVVKPLLAKRGMNMHGAIVFFALLGGLAVFGAVGLILGPLIVAFFLALVRIYERDYARRAPQLGDPTTPPARPA